MVPLSDMTSGDSVLAILIGLLGAFLVHLASKLLSSAKPIPVRTVVTCVSLTPSVHGRLDCILTYETLFYS